MMTSSQNMGELTSKGSGKGEKGFYHFYALSCLFTVNLWGENPTEEWIKTQIKDEGNGITESTVILWREYWMDVQKSRKI